MTVTGRRWPGDDKGRDRSDAPTSWGTPRTADDARNREREGAVLPLSLQRDHGSAGTSIWILASRSVRQDLSAVLSHPVGGTWL